MTPKRTDKNTPIILRRETKRKSCSFSCVACKYRSNVAKTSKNEAVAKIIFDTVKAIFRYLCHIKYKDKI